MKTLFRPALSLFLFFTLLTGLAYPIFLTAISQRIFPFQANGSLITQHGQVKGSELVGQNFDDPRYFWGRLSATSPAHNAAASSGSNLGPLNPVLIESAKTRLNALKKADGHNPLPVPIDLVTASASGLDPEISLAAANYQVSRVARARGLSTFKVLKLVAQATRPRTFGVLGEPGVNVLRLNLALDSYHD